VIWLKGTSSERSLHRSIHSSYFACSLWVVSPSMSVSEEIPKAHQERNDAEGWFTNGEGVPWQHQRLLQVCIRQHYHKEVLPGTLEYVTFLHSSGASTEGRTERPHPVPETESATRADYAHNTRSAGSRRGKSLLIPIRVQSTKVFSGSPPLIPVQSLYHGERIGIRQQESIDSNSWGDHCLPIAQRIGIVPHPAVIVQRSMFRAFRCLHRQRARARGDRWPHVGISSGSCANGRRMGRWTIGAATIPGGSCATSPPHDVPWSPNCG